MKSFSLLAAVLAVEADALSGSGAFTQHISSSKVKLTVSSETKWLNVNNEQEIVFEKELRNGERAQMFSCWQRLEDEWRCDWSAITAFDGQNYTITNYVYTKKQEPKADDFASNESFGQTKGFSSGFTRVWEAVSESTAIGFAAKQSSETKSNDEYSWSQPGQFVGTALSSNKKTFSSYIRYSA